MGLFDLLKKVSDIAEDLDLDQVADKLESAKETLTNSESFKDIVAKMEPLKEAMSKAESQRESRRSFEGFHYEFPEGYVFKPDRVRSRGELIYDMKKLIQDEFPEYQVQCPVPVSRLDSGAHPACTPVTFLFEKGGSYQLAILIVKGSSYKGMNVVGTQRILQEKGIPVIRFWEEYANDDGYVAARIRYYLG